MSDAAQFFGVLTALVVGFAIVRLPPGGVLFSTTWGDRPRRWRTAADAVFRTPAGSLLFGHFTPFGTSFTGAPWPLPVSPAGIATPAVGPPADGRPDDGEPAAAADSFVAFEDLTAVAADGERLLLNGREWTRCGSATAASRWVRRLKRLRELPNEEREGWIRDRLAGDADPVAAAAALTRCCNAVRPVRTAARALFLLCYGALTAALVAEVGPSLPVVFVGYFVLTTWVWWRRRRAAKALAAAPAPAAGDPAAGDPADAMPAGGGWVLFVSPADSFRTADGLIRPHLERFHPAALAVAVAGTQDAEPLVRRARREALHPLAEDAESNDTSAAGVRAWFAAATAEVVARAFGPGEPAPPVAHPDAVAFCPRCEGQYVRGGACPDCGVPLARFDRTATGPPVPPRDVSVAAAG